MHIKHLCVESDDERNHFEQVNDLEYKLDSMFMELGFSKIDDPFSTYQQSTGEGQSVTLNEAVLCYGGLLPGTLISNKLYEHPALGGSLMIGYFSYPGFLVDCDGPDVEGEETSIYCDCTMVLLGLNDEGLKKRLDDVSRPYEKTRASADFKQF